MPSPGGARDLISAPVRGTSPLRTVRPEEPCVSALAIPVTRPSASDEAPFPDGELSLAELLDLFGTAEPVAADRPAARERVSVRARLREWVRRAAGWGAGPQGTWRAW